MNKNKRRAEAVLKELLEKKLQQEENRGKFKKSYSTQWDGYIMVNELGELITPDNITHRFRRFLETHGMRRIRFHDLRHTCASLLLNKGKKNGVTLKDIQVWLGHSTFATTIPVPNSNTKPHTVPTDIYDEYNK